MKRTGFLSLILMLAMTVTMFASCGAMNDTDFAPDADHEIGMAPEGSVDDAISGTPETDDDIVFIENAFISTEKENVSTFSADVDTASYSYFRNCVNSGYGFNSLLNAGSNFRTEEFINYFKYSVNQPQDGELFGVYSCMTPCPWNSENLILRMTLQAETAKPSEGNNLVFLIDVSGSMSSSNKLPLLKKSFTYLVSNLSANDVVSIVTYSGKEEVVLNGCKGVETQKILDAINSLVAKGSTNGEAGLTKAYQVAEENYIEGGNNRIIMASDGDLNVGIKSADELKEYISDKRKSGTYLSVLGFGSGNYRDNNMETLADNGNGVYYYIDGESEAEKIFGTDLLGTLYTVAEDVKLQITFDPNYISEYRLIGYENRVLSKEDFEDDTKDAGEVGASHQVTVCYELKLCENIEKTPQENVEWMKLAVRYKNPGETLSLLNEYSIGTSDYSEQSNEDTEFINCVIETCMILHKSKYQGDISIDSVIEELQSLDLSKYPEREEFLSLLIKARREEIEN